MLLCTCVCVYANFIFVFGFLHNIFLHDKQTDKQTMPQKGDTRTTSRGIVQIYSGRRWQRQCIVSGCTRYARHNRVCRAHYHAPVYLSYKKGDVRTNPSNPSVRERFSGKYWDPLCPIPHCENLIVRCGLCHQHHVHCRNTHRDAPQTDSPCDQDTLANTPNPHTCNAVETCPISAQCHDAQEHSSK